MAQPQKLFVNNTGFEIQGVLEVRAGSNPGSELATVNFNIPANAGAHQMVQYGDPNDPYIDQLTISALTDGAVVLADQIVVQRSSSLDNEFNQNDTVEIGYNNNMFTITSSNTWSNN